MTDIRERPQESQLNIDLSSIADQTLPGYRLQRVEVYNWGTFDKQIWRLNLDGRNGLLTGDIGSGKSTLVDAITTLLVQRAAYNKAAGAETKERSLKSYVHGYYKNERNEIGSSTKPVALRDNNQFSVILAVFSNAGYNSTITIAQIFWTRDPSQPIARTYLCAERDLSISSDLSDFRGDLAALRRKLTGKVELYDSFKEYSAWFRRCLGIDSEQALELFHQTVSMKSVNNLTSFVRTHMLEAFDVESRIRGLIHHFDDLTSSHDAVVKAKNQVAKLKPLVENCTISAQLTSGRDELKACREALKTYFAGQKLNHLRDRIDALSKEWTRQDAMAKRLQDEVEKLRSGEAKLRLDIANNGGGRIEQIRQEIAQQERDLRQRKETASRYESLISTLGEKLPNNNEKFLSQKQLIADKQEAAQQREPQVENELTELEVLNRQKKQLHNDLTAEISGLKSRKNNILGEQIRIRSMVCESLNIDPSEMPFAGELLQVREDERDWEGAAERLLRGFGLSILVPDKYYDKVSQWIDRNHLKGRIVYFRVRQKSSATPVTLLTNSLAHKISIKPKTPFYEWLEREIFHRADFACCDTQDEFKRETRAITRAGLIKKPGEQHEKDDRSRIDDRSRFVLGWSNEAKIKALQSQANALEADINSLTEKTKKLSTEKKHLKDLIVICERLNEYQQFAGIDWQSCAKEIAQLEKERETIEATSDILKQLNEQLQSIIQLIRSTDEAAREQLVKKARTEERKQTLEATSEELSLLVNDPEQKVHTLKFEKIDSLRSEFLGEHKLTVENCDSSERTVRDKVQNRIDAEQKKLDRVNATIVKEMAEYNGENILETREVDANIESAFEYERMLGKLESDDLPRFEARFKQLLNENTINEVANFRSQLDRQRERIKERVDRINESLTKVPYNEGRYIRLEAQPSNEKDLLEFQLKLRACTENTLTGSEDAQYSEAKFLQVKDVIERFRGREGQSDLDRNWTAKVTDVRNWFTFAASERWKEDDREHEHYSDSSGKSGGQKEKLAYTILAASLAYQFNLEWGAARSRSFRFVVIDEAFGRGSDESAQYGLELFKQLNLQLLVVTPLQKIHIIEPYVAGVGYVQNEHGNCSKLRNLTIAEYHEKKAEILGHELV